MSPTMTIAPAGHFSAQAPHPVHRSTTIRATLPILIARASQTSRQTPQPLQSRAATRATLIPFSSPIVAIILPIFDYSPYTRPRNIKLKRL
jgi:hypothetical protein